MTGNGPETVWTKEADAELRKLITEGKSASQIAGQLAIKFAGTFTRSSVIGRCYRQKIKLRAPLRHSPEAVKPRYAPAEDKTLASHGNSCCVWPTGDGPYQFECQRRALPGKPYCQGHQKRAYIPRKKKYK